MEKAWPSIPILGCLLIAGACQDSTGLHIIVRVGDLQYDELRVGVSGAGAQTIVDPDTRGRYVGPFKPGDQDVYVYVADDTDGVHALCTLSAIRGGGIVGEGRGETIIQRHVMKDVVIVMAGSGVDPTGQGGGSGGSGQGTGGGAGTGTAGGPGMGGGPGPGMGGRAGGPPPKLPNGQRCSTAAECISNQCADGVCCESDCASACLSCAQPTTEGLCRPVPPGVPDPRGKCKVEGTASCKTTGLCDVSGQCANYPAGTICEVAACKNDDTLAPLATCDGAGRCQKPPDIKCPSTCAAGVCL